MVLIFQYACHFNAFPNHFGTSWMELDAIAVKISALCFVNFQQGTNDDAGTEAHASCVILDT
jgi:hypothetical protein